MLRVNAVADLLAAKGVGFSRIDLISHGKQIATNEMFNNPSINPEKFRRAELNYVSCKVD